MDPNGVDGAGASCEGANGWVVPSVLRILLAFVIL